MAQTRRREREMVAVAFNQKEQRVLEKSLATIQLEASYSLKLLDLHNRTIKLHFRKMKDKVSRIKSHLPPDEISKLRRLDVEGKLRPMYPPVSPGSALKIAAAARRLHSSYESRYPPGQRHPPRAKSAMPRVGLPADRPQQETLPGTLKRSNSVSGAFIDAPSPRKGTRPSSAGRVLGARKGVVPAATAVQTQPSQQVTDFTDSKNDQLLFASSDGKYGSIAAPGKVLDTGDGTWLDAHENECRTYSGNLKPSDITAHNHHPHHLHFAVPVMNGDYSSSSSSFDSQAPKRPGTRASIISGHTRTSFSDARSALGSAQSRATIVSHHSRAPFSSHIATEKDAAVRERDGGMQHARKHSSVLRAGTASSHVSSVDKNSSATLGLGFGDDAVDDLGEDLFEERRQELLEEEQYRAAAIRKKKDRFLLEIDHYLKEHPPLISVPAQHKAQDMAAAKGHSSAEERDNGLGATMNPRLMRRVEFDASPTYLPESDYRERLLGLWRDMNKCRYLRVPDELIDLSGINTLAVDTLKLYQLLRQREMEPLSNAWAE